MLKFFVGYASSVKWGVIGCIALFGLITLSYIVNITFDGAAFIRFMDGDAAWKAVLFILVYAVCVALFVPSVPLNLLAGFLWGTLYGGVIVASAVTLGGIIAFTLGKQAIGKRLVEKASRKLPDHVFQMLNKHGLATVILIRLNPMFPTSVINYTLGATDMRLFSFVMTTFWPLLLPSLFISSIGARLEDFTFQEADFGIELEKLIIVSLLASATFIGAYGSYMLLKNRKQ